MSDKPKTLAERFCDLKDIDTDIVTYEFSDGHEVTLLHLFDYFLTYAIEQGEFMSHEDYIRFKNEYKGQADLEALCCAVADSEEEQGLVINLLRSENNGMDELCSLQRAKIKSLEAEVKELKERVQANRRCNRCGGKDVKFTEGSSICEECEIYLDNFNS